MDIRLARVDRDGSGEKLGGQLELSSLAGNEPEEIGGGIVVSVAGENLPAGALRLGKSSLKKLASGKFDVG